jgi:hypothetical protein
MAHEVFTGKGMTLTFNAKTAEGLREVNINDDSAPFGGNLDITDSAVTVYTEIPDPLGSSDTPTAKVSITMLDSLHGYADDKLVKQALNQVGALAFAVSADTDDNKWDHATLELLDRTTTIPWADNATATMNFGANTVGAWGKVA